MGKEGVVSQSNVLGSSVVEVAVPGAGGVEVSGVHSPKTWGVSLSLDRLFLGPTGQCNLKDCFHLYKS